jgi:hypothetical protein
MRELVSGQIASLVFESRDEDGRLVAGNMNKDAKPDVMAVIRSAGKTGSAVNSRKNAAITN